MIVFKFMYTNRNRFDASFVKVIALFTCWNQSVQQSIPIVQEVLFPQILKWKNQFQAFVRAIGGQPVRNNMTWCHEWYTFLNGHPKTMVSFSDIGFSSCKITWYNYWFLKTIFQNETSYLFKMIVTIAEGYEAFVFQRKQDCRISWHLLRLVFEWTGSL